MTLADPAIAAKIWDGVVQRMYGANSYQNNPAVPDNEFIHNQVDAMINRLHGILERMGQSDYQF